MLHWERYWQKDDKKWGYLDGTNKRYSWKIFSEGKCNRSSKKLIIIYFHLLQCMFKNYIGSPTTLHKKNKTGKSAHHHIQGECCLWFKIRIQDLCKHFFSPHFSCQEILNQQLHLLLNNEDEQSMHDPNTKYMNLHIHHTDHAISNRIYSSLLRERYKA